MNNILERINQQIQGLEFNLNMLKTSAVSEDPEMVQAINTLTNEIEQLNMYKIHVTNSIGLEKFYEQRKRVTDPADIAMADQQIDIYYAGVGIISIPTNEYELEVAFQQGIKDIKTA